MIISYCSRGLLLCVRFNRFIFACLRLGIIPVRGVRFGIEAIAVPVRIIFRRRFRFGSGAARPFERLFAPEQMNGTFEEFLDANRELLSGAFGLNKEYMEKFKGLREFLGFKE